jgi:hypothetical protein
MHTARRDATATLLKNGKVLIAGGSTLGRAATVYASAELYDPATGLFTQTGSMTAARTDATAVLLSNGKVLIAGGAGCSNPRHCTNVVYGGGMTYLASADLYDPTTGKFSKTGSMAQPRLNADATLLPDGLVLVTGYVARAELYDPDSGKFTPTGKEAAAEYPTTATLLLNGKVLVTGSDYPNTAAQLYDESSGKFTTVSLALPAGTSLAHYKGLAVPRSPTHTATLLLDGRVLLFEGGYLETYDPTSGACADAGFISPAAGWGIPKATLMPDGRVLFEGGGVAPRVTSASVKYNTRAVVLYDPTGGPVRAGTTIGPRIYQTATSLPNGTVLIAGGAAADGTAISSAELYKP